MKRVIMIFTVAAIISACNNNTAKTDALTKEAAYKHIKDSLRLDSLEAAEAQVKAEKATPAPAPVTVIHTSTPRTTYVKGESETYTNTEPAKKKGWSSAAKGAVIGAGAGAVTGVLVDKKDGRGAIIGGVVGAGTGYVIGRDKDKKSGRAK